MNYDNIYGDIIESKNECGDYLVKAKRLLHIDDDKKQLYSRAEGEKIIEKMESVKLIDDAPMPYELELTTKPTETVTIIYPCNYYGELRYVFTKQGNEIVLSESLIRTEFFVNPSHEIRSQCEELLKPEFKKALFKDEFKAYPDSEITLLSEEYGVNYDAHSDTYEFLYSGFIPVMTTQVEGKRYIVSPEKSEEYDGQKTIARISPSSGKVRVEEDMSGMIKYEPDFSTAPIDYNSSPFYNTSAFKIADYFEENFGIKIYGYIYYYDSDVGYVVHDF